MIATRVTVNLVKIGDHLVSTSGVPLLVVSREPHHLHLQSADGSILDVHLKGRANYASLLTINGDQYQCWRNWSADAGADAVKTSPDRFATAPKAKDAVSRRVANIAVGYRVRNTSNGRIVGHVTKVTNEGQVYVELTDPAGRAHFLADEQARFSLGNGVPLSIVR